MAAVDVDFAALEEHVYAGCLDAIATFRAEQDSEDPAVAFAIDASPYYGKFHPSFDTRANALAAMKARDAAVAEDRGWIADPDPAAWTTAHEASKQQGLRLMHDEVGDWSHHMIVEVAWDVRTLTESPRYEELNAAKGDSPDGWLEGHCRGVLTRVCDRLVAADAFAGVAKTSPFAIGYCYGGEPLVICRALYG
jgi:hypothetical protein